MTVVARRRRADSSSEYAAWDDEVDTAHAIVRVDMHFKY
jgi:hypothetical protein